MSCEAELAYLRAAFSEAATNLSGWDYELYARDRFGEYLHPFAKIYERITAVGGGLAMLAELQTLRERIDALEAENAHLHGPLAPMPEYVLVRG